MYSGDQGESYSEPWTYRRRVVPQRTYSGRVVYARKKHYFKLRDATRVLNSIDVGEDEIPADFAAGVLLWIQETIGALLDRALLQISGRLAQQFWGIIQTFMSNFFKATAYEKVGYVSALDLIYTIAAHYGVEVTIKKP